MVGRSFGCQAHFEAEFVVANLLEFPFRERFLLPWKSGPSGPRSSALMIGALAPDMELDRTFFITSVTNARRTIFSVDQNAELFLDVLYGCRAEGKLLIHAFVVMPDHFHLLVTPANDLSLEKCIQFVKGRFSYRLHSRFSVWQPSFTNHRIRGESDFYKHIEYIHQNPVKRGLANRVGEFLFSSANPRFHIDAIPQGLKPCSHSWL